MTFDRRFRAALAALLLTFMSTFALGTVDRAICTTADAGATCSGTEVVTSANEEIAALDKRAHAKLTLTGTNTVAGVTSPTITAYVDGMRFSAKPVNTNSGAVTLNIDTVGAKALVDETGSALQAGEFVSGTAYQIEYFGGADDHFRIMNGLAVTTASSIVFPATQVPSAGANTLDDYEEGTWTPAMTFNASSTGVTYSFQSGTYTKIGRLVHIQGRVVLTSNGTGVGWAEITGLPFTAGSFISYGNGQLNAGGSSASGIKPSVLNASTRILLLIPGATVDAAATDTNCTNTFDYIFTVSYQT